MELTVSELFGLVSLLGIIIVVILQRNTVPVEKISELLEKLGKVADKSDWQGDDAIIDGAKQLFDIALRLGWIQSDESAESLVTKATAKTKELEKSK